MSPQQPPPSPPILSPKPGFLGFWSRRQGSPAVMQPRPSTNLALKQAMTGRFLEPQYTEIELDLYFSQAKDGLPRGEMCDWLSTSPRQQQDTLLTVVADLNQQHWRCALIDFADCLSSPQWRLLTSSGRNWLVKPDDLRSALRCALLLLWSGRFRLITLSGLSAEDVHPEDGAMLQASIPRGSTLLFTQCVSWDGSGEPLATTTVNLDLMRSAAG
ncbi:MAG: hypothetical protein HC924_07570 [Synechococcaceae cyanobacterium SM2_3_2]|nr:hypothetical protein [Synechococcaceae cyanobacterium SM2_3_2]